MAARTVPARRRTWTRARELWASLGGHERLTLLMMTGVVLALHLVGFLTLVAPHRHRLGSGGAFTVGIGVTAYTLGLRHAFDADHIAAIDNMHAIGALVGLGFDTASEVALLVQSSALWTPQLALKWRLVSANSRLKMTPFTGAPGRPSAVGSRTMVQVKRQRSGPSGSTT
jgi:high-affinity nickel permease